MVRLTVAGVGEGAGVGGAIDRQPAPPGLLFLTNQGF
jgi:hypothetical protein